MQKAHIKIYRAVIKQLALLRWHKRAWQEGSVTSISPAKLRKGLR